MKVGIDLDDTITQAPEFFAILAGGLLAKGHEVYVITFGKTEQEAADVLDRLGVPRTGVRVPQGWPPNTWSWKAEVAKRIGLDVMIEDSPEVLDAMPPGVKRLWIVDPDVFDLGGCISELRRRRD